MKLVNSVWVGSLVLFGSALAFASDQPSLEKGQALFQQHCQVCHAAGGWAPTVLSRRMSKEASIIENRMDLPRSYVEAVARSGLNSMPGFRPSELDKNDLQSLSLYLTRNNGR